MEEPTLGGGAAQGVEPGTGGPANIRAKGGGAHAPELAAALGSLVLSAIVLIRSPLPNNDGVYYLLAADTFMRDGLAAASAIHPWPFYSVLIAALGTFPGLSTAATAWGLGALLLALTSAAFVGVVRELGGERKVIWLAAAVALAHPWLNLTRALIVRDAGAWAFGLLALLMALRSDEGKRPGALAGWAVCSAVGVAFRPDAAALMAAVPLAIALAGQMQRRERWLTGAVLLLPALIVGFGVLDWLGREANHPGNVVSTEPFRRAASALAGSFPLPYGREYAPYILAWGLLAIPVVKTLKAAGLAHLALGVLGLVVARLTRFQRAVLVATFAMAVAPLYVQVMRLLFVESRYTVFATLVLSLGAPFGLGWLLRAHGSWRRRLVGSAFGVALIGSLLVSLPVRQAREHHLRDAAEWVRGNAPGARLHTNSLQIAYESGASVSLNLVYQAQIHGAFDGVAVFRGDIWAVRVEPHQAEVRARLGRARKFRPAALFVSDDGDAIFLFKCAAEVCVSGE